MPPHAAATSTPPTTAASTAAAPVDSFLLCADDGRALAAHWTEPADAPARAVAVVSPAAGVPRRFYRAFAQWLSGRGYAVLCYDYRGIGESRGRGPLRADRATMRDWALLDMSAALAAAGARRTRGMGRLPLLLIGHSFGGNAIGFARGVEEADAVLTVASQSGHWRAWPARHQPIVGAFYGLWLPAVVGLFGHLPGWALGAGAQPLPAGVARDWSRWGGMPGYFFGDASMRPHSAFGALVVPVHLWSFEDDWAFAPRQAVDRLAPHFRNAAVQRHHLRPADVGLRRIGHFGMFRRDAGPALWTRLLAPVEHAAPALRAALDGAPTPA